MRAATETQIPFAAAPLGGDKEKVLGKCLGADWEVQARNLVHRKNARASINALEPKSKPCVWGDLTGEVL